MSKLEPLLDRYEQNRVVRALVQLIPLGIGGAIDVILSETLEKIRIERASVFFDELSKGSVLVDEGLLKSEDFVHAFLSTARRALNTRRREKVAMFARLLKRSLMDSILSDSDEYEDLLSILDELSYRELLALGIMDQYHDRPRDSSQNDLQWVDTFWDDFERRLTTELQIPKDEVASFMNRIARTGCYEMFTGTYWSYTGGKGKLTPTFHKLKRYIFERHSSG